MDNYKDFIDQLVDVFDICEENLVDTEVILDSEIAYDLACELEYLGKPFNIEEEDGFERDLAENDILGVALSVYEDGSFEYFLQPVLSHKDDITLMDDVTKLLIIEEELLDIVDIEQFCQVEDLIVLESEYDEEDIEDIEEVLDEITDEIFDTVLEAEENGECVHCAVKEYLRELLIEEE